MKHTDFYDEYRNIDNIAREELIAAVKAHGGSYNFYEENKNIDLGVPIILASFKHAETTEDHYVTRLEVDENGYLTIFGYPKEYGQYEDELFYIPFGQYDEIIDHIPETEGVKDVSTPKDFKTYVVFGEDVVRKIASRVSAIELKEYIESKYYELQDAIKFRTFNTLAAQRAYIQGLDDCSDYLEYYVCSPEYDKDIIEMFESNLIN